MEPRSQLICIKSLLFQGERLVLHASILSSSVSYTSVAAELAFVQKLMTKISTMAFLLYSIFALLFMILRLIFFCGSRSLFRVKAF